MPQIKITDLIDNAVENALARREQALTTEEANQIQGGFNVVPFPFGRIISPKRPIIMGKIFPIKPIKIAIM